MPGPKPPTVDLTEEERQELEKLIRRHSTPQQIALRARIVLAAAEEEETAPEVLPETGAVPMVPAALVLLGALSTGAGAASYVARRRKVA